MRPGRQALHLRQQRPDPLPRFGQKPAGKLGGGLDRVLRQHVGGEAEGIADAAQLGVLRQEAVVGEEGVQVARIQACPEPGGIQEQRAQLLMPAGAVEVPGQAVPEVTAIRAGGPAVGAVRPVSVHEAGVQRRQTRAGLGHQVVALQVVEGDPAVGRLTVGAEEGVSSQPGDEGARLVLLEAGLVRPQEDEGRLGDRLLLGEERHLAVARGVVRAPLLQPAHTGVEGLQHAAVGIRRQLPVHERQVGAAEGVQEIGRRDAVADHGAGRGQGQGEVAALAGHVGGAGRQGLRRAANPAGEEGVGLRRRKLLHAVAGRAEGGDDLRPAGGEEQAARRRQVAEGGGVPGLPHVVEEEQALLAGQRLRQAVAPPVHLGAARPGGAQGLDGALLQVEDAGRAGVLTDGEPEDAVAEAPAHRLVAGEGGGQDRLPQAAHTVQADVRGRGAGHRDGASLAGQEQAAHAAQVVLARKVMRRVRGNAVESGERESLARAGWGEAQTRARRDAPDAAAEAVESIGVIEAVPEVHPAPALQEPREGLLLRPDCAGKQHRDHAGHAAPHVAFQGDVQLLVLPGAEPRLAEEDAARLRVAESPLQGRPESPARDQVPLVEERPEALAEEPAPYLLDYVLVPAVVRQEGGVTVAAQGPGLPWPAARTTVPVPSGPQRRPCRRACGCTGTTASAARPAPHGRGCAGPGRRRRRPGRGRAILR